MRELVVKYKAEKVCHEEMVKIPLVDLKLLEYKERYRLRRPVSFGAYRDERVVRIIARVARICMDYRKLSEIAIRNCCHQMRVHEEEITKTDFRTRLHEVKGGARVAFKDKFRAAEEREVLCEAQQGRSAVKRKLFGSFRNKIGVRDEECDLDGSRVSIIHFQSVGLNMRQRRWMKLFSDYGYETKYHMGKANIVVDAWRRKGGVKPRRV
nr:putative reverse transcriptase domain-containing protein [Tanacetum cinerariifolium]